MMDALTATPEADFARAEGLLSVGRYAEAWPLYEARRRIERFSIPSLARTPSWTGQDIAGKRLLVFGEQGFGDQIMFARFLPELRRRGAEVLFYVYPPLARLFPGSIPADWKTWPQSDYYIPIGSLPWLLGATLDNLPPPVDLNIPSTAEVGVGLCLFGRPEHPNDAHRSLRIRDGARLATAIPDAIHLHPIDLKPNADFRDTAEIIAGLELVITVDTAVAHLAASLGKPTWILLPKQHVDWRWGLEGSASKWYPSATLYRQSEDGWEGVIDQVLRDLG